MRLVTSIKCAAPALLLGCLCLPLQAQTQKVQEPHQLWAGFEAEYEASEKNTFYLDHQWRHASQNTGENITDSGIFSSFEDIRISIGYERALAEFWSVEMAQRVSFERDETKWYNRFMLNYERVLGPIELESRFMYEHIRARDTSPEREKLRPENRVRGNLGAARPFRIGSLQFELMAEGELLFYLNEKPELEPRLTDRSRLEAGITYLLSPQVGITLYGIRQVRYKREQPAAEGPETSGSVKLNEVTPILGLELEIELP